MSFDLWKNLHKSASIRSSINNSINSGAEKLLDVLGKARKKMEEENEGQEAAYQKEKARPGYVRKANNGKVLFVGGAAGSQEMTKGLRSQFPWLRRLAATVHDNFSARKEAIKDINLFASRMGDIALGTYIKHKDKKKPNQAVINLNKVKAGRGGSFSLRNIANHEAFHAQVPVLGQSEMLAHMYGGFNQRRVRGVKDLATNLATGLVKMPLHLALSRPDRFLIEAGLATGAAVGGKAIADKLNQQDEPGVEKIAKSPELKGLLRAKKLSDKHDYVHKNELVRKLLEKNPEAFRVDSHLNQKYVGITHIKSGFRIHAPRSVVPSSLINPYPRAEEKK